MKLDDTYRINKVGNCSNGRNEGGMVYAVNGLSPTITAGTHGWGMGYFIIYEEDKNGVQVSKVRENGICEEDS